MEKKYSLILDDEFIQYCKLNNIEDIEKLAKETFNKGFIILKYGEIHFIGGINASKVIDSREELKVSNDKVEVVKTEVYSNEDNKKKSEPSLYSE